MCGGGGWGGGGGAYKLLLYNIAYKLNLKKTWKFYQHATCYNWTHKIMQKAIWIKLLTKNRRLSFHQNVEGKHTKHIQFHEKLYVVLHHLIQRAAATDTSTYY